MEDIKASHIKDTKSFSDRMLVLERPYSKAVISPSKTLNKTTSTLGAPPLTPTAPSPSHISKTTHSTPLDPSAPPISPADGFNTGDIDYGPAVDNTHVGHVDNHGDTSDDSDSSRDTDDEGNYTVKTRYTDPSNCAAQVIMFCDSIPKYVKPSIFFGDKKVKIYRTGNIEKSASVLSSFTSNDSVQTFILHLGIHDCRATSNIRSAGDSLHTFMSHVKEKYNNAKVLYSATLLTSDSALNTKIRALNEQMKDFCSSNDSFLFVEHRKLQTQ